LSAWSFVKSRTMTPGGCGGWSFDSAEACSCSIASHSTRLSSSVSSKWRSSGSTERPALRRVGRGRTCRRTGRRSSSGCRPGTTPPSAACAACRARGRSTNPRPNSARSPCRRP